jgi:hypothetical protein
MPTVQRLPLDAFVVGAEFIGDVPAFALGDGRRIRAAASGDGQGPWRRHPGGAEDHRRPAPVTGGDDGRVSSIDAAGAVTPAERPRKWIDQPAVGRDGSWPSPSARRRWSGSATARARSRTSGPSPAAFAPKGARSPPRANGVSLWWVNTAARRPSSNGRRAYRRRFLPDGRFLVTVMQENALHGWRSPTAVICA